METTFLFPALLVVVVVVCLGIFFHFVPFFLWLNAKVSGVHISLIQLFLMRLRNVPPTIIVESLIEAHKAGLKTITRDNLEAHYMTGGHVQRVVHALVSAAKANIDLSFEKATAIDLAGRDVFEAVQTSVNPKVIDTPPKELELIYHFASNPNRVYTRDQLLDEVWGFDYYGDSRTVDVHVKRLREKLEGVSDKWSLKTVWGVGYKFETKE